MSSFNRMLALAPRVPERDFATMLESDRQNIGDVSSKRSHDTMHPGSAQPSPKKTKLNDETPPPKTSDTIDHNIRSSSKRSAPVSPVAEVCFKKLAPEPKAP